MNARKEIVWIDALRGFMAFIVVAAHTLDVVNISDAL